MFRDYLAKASYFFLTSCTVRPTIERSLFIAVTLCCGGIFGISWDISWSVIPFGFALQSSTTLSSKSTASTASCLMTTSATAILISSALGLVATRCYGLVTEPRPCACGANPRKWRFTLFKLILHIAWCACCYCETEHLTVAILNSNECTLLHRNI